MTVRSTSKLDEKWQYLKKEYTSVAVLNSLNPIQCQLNPRILSNTTKEAWEPGEPEEPEQTTGHQRKRLASTLAHQSVRSFFHLTLSQRWWYSMSSVLRPVFPSRDCALEYPFHSSFCLTNHHVVLECPPITLLMNIHSSTCSWLRAAADFQILFGVQHAELNAELLRHSKTFISLFMLTFFTLCVTWCWLLLRRSASHRWHTSLVCYENFFSFSHFFTSFFWSHCVIFFE